jgi:arsenate reductase-like glutaredoxin family protein
MGAATSKNSNLDGEALDYLTTAFTRANDNIANSATQIDAILQDPIFKTGIFKEGGIQIDYLRGIKKDIDTNILDSGQKDLIALSKKIREFTKIGSGDRPSLSFGQMYQLREAIETLKGKNFNIESARGVKSAITQKGLDQMNDVVKELDKFMTPQSVEDLLRNQSSFIKDSSGRTILDRADALIKEHRDLYNSTMKIFSDVESTSGIKNLRNAVQTGEDIDVKDMMKALIRNNEPETLRKAFDAIGTGDIAGVGNKEAFRKLMAGQWLRNAMVKSNIDSLTPNKFNGQMFLKEIDQLGNTAKELFGKEAGKIRELGIKIAKTDFNNLTKEAIEEIWEGSPNTIEALQGVLKATKDEANLKKFNFLRQISEGRFNALQAADSLAQDRSTKRKSKRILFKIVSR